MTNTNNKQSTLRNQYNAAGMALLFHFTKTLKYLDQQLENKHTPVDNATAMIPHLDTMSACTRALRVARHYVQQDELPKQHIVEIVCKPENTQTTH